jgi:serine/threonine protein phosphatase PrpC
MKKAKELINPQQSNVLTKTKVMIEHRENMEPNIRKKGDEEMNLKGTEPLVMVAAHKTQRVNEMKEEELYKEILKPIVRVQTGLNLSDYASKIEGSNGPILNIEDPEENHKEQLNTPENNEVKVEYKNGVKVEDSKQIESEADHKAKVVEESKDSEPCYWKLPMSQWPKCKKKESSKVSYEEKVEEVQKVVMRSEPIRKPTIENVNDEVVTNDQVEDIPVYKFVAGFSFKAKDDEEGDDACFTCERGLGVADGVSGWSTYGINPSAFSQKLIQECEKEIRRITKLKKENFTDAKRARIPKVASYVGLDFQANTIYSTGGSDAETSEPESESNMPKVNKRSFEIPVDALQILTTSYNKIRDIGSSTAIVVTINQNEVHAANLGDSGFIHLSQKQEQYYIKNISKEQQHEFNVPFQLSCFPSEEYLTEMEKEGRAKEAKQLRFMIEKKKLCKDDPETADQYNYKVMDGDIFVLGTDGIFDNVFSYEIKDIIKNCMLNVTKITNRVAKVI